MAGGYAHFFLSPFFSRLRQNVVCPFCTNWRAFGDCLFFPQLKKGQKVEPFFLTFFPFRRSVAANSDIKVLSILAAM